MATRWYLHAATTDVAGTLPSGEQGAGTPGFSFANATTIRRLNPVVGAAQTSVAGTTLGQSTAQRGLIGMWMTPPLAAQNIAAGTWTFNIAAAESNTAANFWPNLVNVYVWRPGTGALVGTVLDQSNGASLGGAEPGAANSERVVTFTFSGSAVNSIQAGDVLVVEAWTVFTQGNTTSRTATVYFDGATVSTTANAVVTDHAAFVDSPADIAVVPSTTSATASVVVAKTGSRALTVRAIGLGADLSAPVNVVYAPADTVTSQTTASVSVQDTVSVAAVASTSIQGAIAAEAVASVTVAQGSTSGSAGATASVSVQGEGSANATGSVSLRDTLSASTTASTAIQAAVSAATAASVTVVGATLHTLTARAIGPGADISAPYAFQHGMPEQGSASVSASVVVQTASSALTSASVSVEGSVASSTTASVVVQGPGTQRVVTLRAVGPGADVSSPVSLTYNVQATITAQVVASVSVQSSGEAQTAASVSVQSALVAEVAPSVSVQGPGAATAVASTSIASSGLGSAATTASVTVAPAYGVYDVSVQSGEQIDLGAPYVVTGFAYPYVGVAHPPGDGIYVTSVRITIDSLGAEYHDAPVQANGSFSVNIGSQG